MIVEVGPIVFEDFNTYVSDFSVVRFDTKSFDLRENWQASLGDNVTVREFELNSR